MLRIQCLWRGICLSFALLLFTTLQIQAAQPPELTAAPKDAPESLFAGSGGAVAGSPASVDFAQEVIPIMTRAGCNSGACHGAASGRGYLSLSLFGSRPQDDYEALVHAPGGRFLDTEDVLGSRLLQKAGGYLEHGGGVRLDSEGDDFRRLRQWIASGAASGSMASLEQISVQPGRELSVTAGETVSVSFNASWSDGSQRDVSAWVVIGGAKPWQGGSEVLESSPGASKPPAPPASTTVDGDQPTRDISREASEAVEQLDAPVTYRRVDQKIIFCVKRPGYWPITVRFASLAQTLQIWCRPTSEPPSESAQAQSRVQVEQVTFGDRGAPSAEVVAAAESGSPVAEIDRLTAEYFHRIGLKAAPPVAPILLARRLHIDLTGHHPALELWRADAEEIRQGRTRRVVDRLLESKAFSQRAAEQIASWAKSTAVSKRQSAELTEAIAIRLQKDDDLRELAKRMLHVPADKPSQHGSELASQRQRTNSSHPLHAFHRLANDPRSRAELVASVWMGVRIGCAQCHDHPLDHWTQDDYFAMSACWAEVDTTGTVKRISGRTTTDLRNGERAWPKLPDGTPLNGHHSAPDQAFVDWLCDPETPYLADNLANRIWFWMMGTGIVDEVDDQRATNPPLQPELLAHLADQLRKQGFRLRPLVRQIVLSQAYRRQSSSDARRLEIRLAAVRQPKVIQRSLVALSADALQIEPGNANAEDSSDTIGMQAEPVREEACLRDAACSDPLSQSLTLVAGGRLNDLITRVVLRAWHEAPQLTLVERLDAWHQQLFGESMPTSVTVGVQEFTPRNVSAENASAKNLAEQAVAEDVLWSWLVSNRFRQLH